MDQRVVRLINRGGFGRVEEVDVNGQRLAQKVFDPRAIAYDAELVAKAKRRFVREANVQSQLDHPNIMPILGSDPSAEPPWILMPLATKSLEDEIVEAKAAGTIPVDALVQMLTGLEELHRLGFVHRDLKPRNVLLVGGRWVIADFGFVLPRIRGTTILTATGSAWGTEGYAAPEIITDFRSALSQADIFAAGCILHDLVGTTPRVPFAQSNAPGPLGPIIEKCTAREPSDRFTSVAALRSAILFQLEGAPSEDLGPEVDAWLKLLMEDCRSIDQDTWTRIALSLETQFEVSGGWLLRAMDLDQLEAVFTIAPAVFTRIAVSFCRWVRRRKSFDFSYCDLLGARLIKIFDLGGTREKAEAAMAALILGCSHNRWSVMKQFMRMASPGIDQDLADRLAIELLALGTTANDHMKQMEFAIRAQRSSLHPKIVDALARCAPTGD